MKKNGDALIVEKVVKLLNNEFNGIINVTSNTRHILERFTDRNLHVIDFQKAYLLLKKHLCLFTYYSYLPEDVRPFRIFIKTDDIILTFSRMTDSQWKISTVLDPKKHNKYDDKGNFVRTIEG